MIVIFKNNLIKKIVSEISEVISFGDFILQNGVFGLRFVY
jgi:hypothetical protein